MKIDAFRCSWYRTPYKTPITNGKYTYTHTDINIVTLKTDDGLTGTGWAHGGKIVFDTLRDMKERVMGEDPFNVERIWESLYLPKVYGRKGLTTRAISAVDIACWDLIGKAAGRPVHRMVGGFRDSVPAYIAGGYYEKGKGHKELAEEMKANVALGARTVKMKIGGATIRDDLERIDVVRQAVGPDVGIMVDANNGYDRPTALKMGRELDRRGDIFWFEEPLSPDDLEGCGELRRRLDVPVAIGENEYTRHGFQQLVAAGAATVFNADAQILGGITEWLKVAHIAQANHILIAPHGDQDIHVHLVAGVSNGMIVEYCAGNVNALNEAMFKNRLTIDAGGGVRPHAEPGLGVEIDFERLEPLHVRTAD